MRIWCGSARNFHYPLELAGKRDEFCLIAMNLVFEILGNIIFPVIGTGCIGWLFIRSIRRSENPPLLILKWLITLPLIASYIWVIMPAVSRGGFEAIGGILLAVVWGNLMVIIWGLTIVSAIAKPFTSLFDGGDEPPEPKPYYSIAQARRKRREFLEAVVAVREQLARFPNDFEGVSLLAGIQAEDLQDLPGAEITLNHFCDQPNPPPRQFAAAMNQLADWHLKLAQDADSARAALEKIVARFPGTELALQAAQRIAHLGGTEKQWLASLDRQPMAVPEGVKSAGLRDSMKDLIPDETDPARLAADYVKHLEQHPLDTEAREKLAIIYARHYKRLDMATLELAQLINQPNQPHKRVAHWLNLLADLQIHGGADYDTVRGTLEKIVELFPGLPVAQIAQSRLGRLKLEFRGKEETPGIKLGVYEQNIGLKYGSPRQL